MCQQSNSVKTGVDRATIMVRLAARSKAAAVADASSGYAAMQVLRGGPVLQRWQMQVRTRTWWWHRRPWRWQRQRSWLFPQLLRWRATIKISTQQWQQWSRWRRPRRWQWRPRWRRCSNWRWRPGATLFRPYDSIRRTLLEPGRRRAQVSLGSNRVRRWRRYGLSPRQRTRVWHAAPSGCADGRHLCRLPERDCASVHRAARLRRPVHRHVQAGA